MPEDPSKPKLHIETDFKSRVDAERQAEPEADPGLQVDADWKAQAQAEKERLAAEEARKEASPEDAARGKLPAADFKELVRVLAWQAIMGLGALGDPQTGRRVVDLEGAKFSIDLLGVLDQKTEGNLSAEESRELKQVLAELRSQFVQVTNLIAQQGTAEPPGPGVDTPPGET